MPVPVAAGVGAIAGASGGGKTKSGLPNDILGTRDRQIDLLNYLLGFGNMTPGNRGSGGPSVAGQGAENGGKGPPSGDVISQRLAAFFGPLGVPTTGLQQQALGRIGDSLSGPQPEQQAFDWSSGALKNILGSAPGAGIIDALRPSFERNLASANQTGARFSSGNEILRGNALNDFNLLGAQAAQQGIAQQIAAAQALGVLGESAGNNPFNRAQGAYQTGTAQAGQNDVETQRRIQLILALLQTAQGATLGGPTKTSGGGFAGAIGGATDMAALLAALGGGAKASTG